MTKTKTSDHSETLKKKKYQDFILCKHQPTRTSKYCYQTGFGTKKFKHLKNSAVQQSSLSNGRSLQSQSRQEQQE